MGYKKIFYNDISKANAAANSVCRKWNDQLKTIEMKLQAIADEAQFQGAGASRVKVYIKETYPILIKSIQTMIEAFYRQFQLYETGFLKEVDDGGKASKTITLFGNEIKEKGTVYTRLTNLFDQTYDIQKKAIAAVRPVSGMIKGGVPLPDGNNLLDELGKTRKIAVNLHRKAENYENRHSKDLQSIEKQIRTIRNNIVNLSGKNRSFIFNYKSGQIKSIFNMEELMLYNSECEKVIESFYKSKYAVEAEYRTLTYKEDASAEYQDKIYDLFIQDGKMGLSAIEKFSKDDSEKNEAGFSKAIISYLDGLISLADTINSTEHSDMNNLMPEWMKFADKSASAYSGIYDYLQTKLFNNNIVQGAKFGEGYQHGAGVVSLIGSVLGFGGDAWILKNTINDDSKTLDEKTIQGLNTAKSGTNVVKSWLSIAWGKKAVSWKSTCVEWKSVGNNATKLEKANTVFSLLGVTIDVCKATYSKTREVTADGHLTTEDIGSVGVSGAVHGLASVVSTLTYGILDFTPQADAIANAAEHFAKSEMTDYAVNHPISRAYAEYSRDLGAIADNESNPIIQRVGASAVEGAGMITAMVADAVVEGVNVTKDVIGNVASEIVAVGSNVVDAGKEGLNCIASAGAQVWNTINGWWK